VNAYPGYNNFIEPQKRGANPTPTNAVRYNKSKSDLRRITSISPVEEDPAARRMGAKKPS
jgi:hypothetical protein